MEVAISRRANLKREKSEKAPSQIFFRIDSRSNATARIMGPFHNIAKSINF